MAAVGLFGVVAFALAGVETLARGGVGREEEEEEEAEEEDVVVLVGVFAGDELSLLEGEVRNRDGEVGGMPTPPFAGDLVGVPGGRMPEVDRIIF
jgi:hypothetical protein